jgi:hypothetical protein
MDKSRIKSPDRKFCAGFSPHAGAPERQETTLYEKEVNEGYAKTA